jgi:hypothetical protein
MQVNNWRGKKNDTDDECAPVCVSFLIGTERGPEALVEDGMQVCCLARCAVGHAL